MAGVRNTITGVGGRFLSRTPGTQMGVQLNTFVMRRLAERINGDALKPILLKAMEKAEQQALQEWPVLTGASRDTITVEVIEVTPTSCRVALMVGGEKLIADIRNTAHKDYAPFVEFRTGVLTRAMATSNLEEAVHEGVSELIVRESRG